MHSGATAYNIRITRMAQWEWGLVMPALMVGIAVHWARIGHIALDYITLIVTVIPVATT